jgi:hypothetical protein
MGGFVDKVNVPLPRSFESVIKRALARLEVMSSKHFRLALGRAWRETAIMLGIDSMERIGVLLAVQFAIAFGIYFLATDPASGLLVRILTAAAPFALFPIVLFWKWLRLPVQLIAETSTPLHANAIAMFMDTGARIQEGCSGTANWHAVRAQQANWIQEVDQFLNTKVGGDYAARFRNARNTISTAITGLSAEVAELYRDVQSKNDALADILRDLRR